jgi:hypothetical protein
MIDGCPCCSSIKFSSALQVHLRSTYAGAFVSPQDAPWPVF